jgi:hypothetical protein
MDEDAQRRREPRTQRNRMLYFPAVTFRSQHSRTSRLCCELRQVKTVMASVSTNSTGIRRYNLNTSGQQEVHVGSSRLGYLVPGIFGVSHFPPTQANELRGFTPQSELYRPSDRRLSAKLVPTLADRGCRVVSERNPHGR